MLGGVRPFAGQAPEAAKPEILGVVGRWSEVVDQGESVILVEDSRGRTRPPAEVEQISTSLFGRVDPSFVANAAAPGAFELGVLRNVPRFTEGGFRARFKLISGAGDQTAGLVFDLRPKGEYSYVRFNTKDGNIALWRYAGGQRHLVIDGTNHVELPLNVWHDLSLSISGTRLVGSVNDRLRLEHTLQGSVDSRVGFWAKRDSQTMFHGHQGGSGTRRLPTVIFASSVM